jgi:hypothetical protein
LGQTFLSAMPLTVVWSDILGVSQPFVGRSSAEFIEARRFPLFKLEFDIRVYARNRPVVRGHTAAISESGTSAMPLEEITLDEVVRLEFTAPSRKSRSPGAGSPARCLRDLAIAQWLHGLGPH